MYAQNENLALHLDLKSPVSLDELTLHSKALGLSFGSLFMSCLPRSEYGAKRNNRRSVAGWWLVSNPSEKICDGQVGHLSQRENKHILVVATSR